ncbi:MAG: MBL fold metallo-hydrolase [Firmicutes bacterium]|nr:MBL fold metallo-hydrolase [Bacillota bacterium]
MNVRYLGHCSFLINSSKGSSIITDPYGVHLPYKFPMISADVVVISHEHQDHNAEWRVGGSPVIVKRTTSFPVEHEVPVQRTKEKLVFQGIPTFHDNFSGRRRGPNTTWVWHLEGVRYVFLGDVGHVLTDKQVEAIGGDADILFLPVGGLSTVGSTEAALIVNQLNPKIVLPMHYNTAQIEFSNLASEPLENFLNKMENVEMTYTMSIDIDLARLPMKTKVMVLKYE